jgi:exopolysaccharide/PEP-CTERM locus tyrosine autokinase
MKMGQRPVPERELSLIERAEALWGFGDGLKPAGAPVREAAAEARAEPETASLDAGLVKRKPVSAAAPVVVEDEPASDEEGTGLAFLHTEAHPDAGVSESELSDPNHHPGERRGPGGTQPETGPRRSPGWRAETDPGLVDPAPAPIVPEVEALDDEDLAQPLDLSQPLPDWAAPTGVAAIDRVMLAQKGMLVPGAPIGALAEEFRLVKRQLLLTARQVAEGPLGQRARTILVGSGKPGDGKTYSAINLAISLAAERDVEILLVDADFAKPDVMKTLGLEDSVGFLDVLGDPTLDPETCIVRTDVPQLCLLPAGASTTMDTELLASRRTDDVIDRLLAANPKRMIVFDTPPTLAASPASVLALQVGQVMLVVRADRTTEADVREAVSLLDGCEHISLVLNAVSYQPGGGRFGSYYGQEKSK